MPGKEKVIPLQWGCGKVPQKMLLKEKARRTIEILQWGCGKVPQKMIDI